MANLNHCALTSLRLNIGLIEVDLVEWLSTSIHAKTLRSLNLSELRLNDTEFFNSFHSFTALESLVLGAPICLDLQKAMSSLSKYLSTEPGNQLEELSISFNINHEVFNQFKSMPKLKSLSIGLNDFVTPIQLPPSLKNLNLVTPYISDFLKDNLCNSNNLTKLILSEIKLDPSSILVLSEKQHHNLLPNLTTLHILFYKIKSDYRKFHLDKLFESFGSNTKLVEFRIGLFSDSAPLEHLLKQFPNGSLKLLRIETGKFFAQKHLFPLYPSLFYYIDYNDFLHAFFIFIFTTYTLARMFKKLSLKGSASANNQIKSSLQRNIRNSILTQYPALNEIQEEVFPKKVPIVLAKCQNNINLILVNNEVIFFNEREGPYYPTIRFLHKYPNILPHLQVDRGAIKFVLQGANIMCRGLTSPGARMETDVPANSIVAIMAEGKQHAAAVGLTKMSTQDIRTINSDIGVINIHYLNDSLYCSPNLE
eukprot:gene2258-2781_t